MQKELSCHQKGRGFVSLDTSSFGTENHITGKLYRNMRILLIMRSFFVAVFASLTLQATWAQTPHNLQKREAEDMRTVRILAVGNSFAIDAMESPLYDIAQASGIRLILGNACQAGYSLQNHWNGLVTNLDILEYRKCEDRHYDVTKGYTLNDILADEPWDYITFQQTSYLAGFCETYEPHLTNLIEELGKRVTNPQVKYGFYMIWAYGQNSTSENFYRYDHNQMTMYDSIVNATSKAMQEHPQLEFLIPTGTAIQNMRTSFVGDNLTRDGAHLTVDMGRSIAAYTWFATLFGTELMMQNNFIPNCLNECTTRMAKKCVVSALESPYSITPQTYTNYTGDNSIAHTDINLNFSFDGTQTEGWNDVNLHHTLTAGFKDSQGRDCGIVLQCNSPFGSANTAGPQNTDTSLDMPTSVSETALWGYGEGQFNNDPQTPTTTLHFTHLNKTLAYDFTFFSSRAYATDNRETQFTLIGTEKKTATLNASNNTSQTTTITDILSDTNGCITLIVQAGPKNDNPYKFYYLNALKISPHKPSASAITSPKQSTALKVNKDKHIYIKNGDQLFTLDGKRIK